MIKLVLNATQFELEFELHKRIQGLESKVMFLRCFYVSNPFILKVARQRKQHADFTHFLRLESNGTDEKHLVMSLLLNVSYAYIRACFEKENVG